MAKKFQFRLEQVLSLKKQLEDLRVRELALAKGKLLEVEEALQVHHQADSEFLEMYGEFEKTGSFTSDQVSSYVEYREWLLRREKELKIREKEWAAEVEKRRQVAVKASREKRLLENLRDKKEAEHEKEVSSEEQKFLDEISSIAFIRSERAKGAVSGALANN